MATFAVSGRVADAHPPAADGVALQLDASRQRTSPGPRCSRWPNSPRNKRQSSGGEIAEAAAEPVDARRLMPSSKAKPHERPHAQRGDPEKLGDEIPRRWLEVFGGQPVPAEAAAAGGELAEWIVRAIRSRRGSW